MAEVSDATRSTNGQPGPPDQTLQDAVREYWDREPCGTGPEVVAGRDRVARGVWYDAIEDFRYTMEPFIHSVAQFTRHRGKELLEIGVGAGTDHLQWARAGAICTGVDLTQAAVALTRDRLAREDLQSNVLVADAESLPLAPAAFDLVYSWGVIHHSAHPDRVVSEIHRVLRPGGRFIVMVYARHSAVAWKQWIRHALLTGHPSMTMSDVLARYMESPGTKAYTTAEVRDLFHEFEDVRIQRLATPYDRRRLPGWLGRGSPTRSAGSLSRQAPSLSIRAVSRPRDVPR